MIVTCDVSICYVGHLLNHLVCTSSRITVDGLAR